MTTGQTLTKTIGELRLPFYQGTRMEDERITIDPYIRSEIEGRLRTARAILEMTAVEMENNNMQLWAGDVMELAHQAKTIQYKITD